MLRMLLPKRRRMNSLTSNYPFYLAYVNLLCVSRKYGQKPHWGLEEKESEVVRFYPLEAVSRREAQVTWRAREGA